MDDIEAARERVVAHGGKAGDVNESPICRSVFVTDPDGNRFALHQRKAEQAAAQERAS